MQCGCYRAVEYLSHCFPKQTKTTVCACSWRISLETIMLFSSYAMQCNVVCFVQR